MDGIQERLAHIRSETGLGLRSFAGAVEERAGYAVSHTTVASYESGGTVPVAYALAVAEAFDLEPRWLVNGEGSSRGNGLDDFFYRYPAPALAVDREDLSVLEANEAFRQRFGESEDRGDRLAFLVHPEDRDDVHAALEGEAGDPVRVRLQSGDGYRRVTLRPFQARGTVFCTLLDVEGAGQEELELSSERERTGP